MLIVCGTDFSIHASEAASVAAILAAHLRGTLLLVHVYREKGLRIPSQAAFDVLHQRWEARLATEATRCRGLGAVVETQLLPGSPSAVLRDLAVRRRADLIVLSSLSGVPPVRWLLGRVAERVAEYARVPTLVARARAKAADLVLVGIKRPRGFARLWHHPAARDILRKAPMSVVCVPWMDGRLPPLPIVQGVGQPKRRSDSGPRRCGTRHTTGGSPLTNRPSTERDTADGGRCLKGFATWCRLARFKLSRHVVG